MRYKISVLITQVLIAFQVSAQQFINKGNIKFEVITNVKKTMGTNGFDEQLKDLMPTFKLAYYNYSFAGNKSIFKFDRYDEKKGKLPEFLKRNEDTNEWYSDFNTGLTYMQKSIWGSPINFKDSIVNIQWKLSNESLMIAGFNCRKATGKIMDSVYVFAFYTDEITISGGPCSINGLPGMIMGVTIPRLYMSMLATKLMLNDVKESTIKPITVKKYYTNKEIKSMLDKRIEDWSADEDGKKYMDQMYWNTLL
jgi:GLPGLI family protein